VRMSRGVGTSVVTVRRRVAAPKGSATKTVVRSVRVQEQHIGVDLAAPRGTPVHAVSEAKVAFAGTRAGYGKLVILDHGGGYQTYYAHLSVIPVSVRPGAAVTRGQQIGLVGSTGHSTGYHLHFEIRKDARFIDPFDVKRQLDSWVLSAGDQERLLMQILRIDEGTWPPGVAAAPLCPATSLLALNKR
jgi:murein DD-endopeptidase MepM/ murein hydrolase activator NlpD